MLQGVSHAPQCAGSVFRFVSQPFVASPSQLPLPSRQTSAHAPFAQLPPAQSLSTLQAWPGEQVGQALPPQSLSVSAPFLILSEHVGCEQVPLAQTPLSQSVACTHLSPGVQGEQPPPPQSTSVSLPDWTPSVQEAF